MSHGSFVYFLRPIGMPGPVKIGCSKTPERRLSELMCWSPLPLEIVYTTVGGYDLERALHDCFADLHMHREWFRAAPRLTDAIDRMVAGEPLRDVIDLTAKSGSIRRLGKGSRPRSPAMSYKMSWTTKLWAAKRRAERLAEDRRFSLPRDVWVALSGISAENPTLTAGQVARLQAVIDDPVAHMAVEVSA